MRSLIARSLAAAAVVLTAGVTLSSCENPIRDSDAGARLALSVMVNDLSDTVSRQAISNDDAQQLAQQIRDGALNSNMISTSTDGHLPTTMDGDRRIIVTGIGGDSSAATLSAAVFASTSSGSGAMRVQAPRFVCIDVRAVPGRRGHVELGDGVCPKALLPALTQPSGSRQLALSDLPDTP